MYKACVVTVSDRAYNKIYEDKSGPAIAKMLNDCGYEVAKTLIVPDETDIIIAALKSCVKDKIELIITTGGTGFSKRDVTVEATQAVIEKNAPGIAEYMRQKSMEITPRAMLSRGIAGIKDESLIINLPGSVKGATENLGFVLPYLNHGLDIIKGLGED